MPKREIRFGLSDGNGLTSNTWKCWSPTGQKKDIYVANRFLGNVLKVSVHESGRCHIAYSDDFTEDQPSLKTRYVDQWDSPPPLGNGVIIALRVVIPNSAVMTPEDSAKAGKISWIPTCPDRIWTEIDILITPPEYQSSDWPGKNSMNNELVGRYTLSDNSILWITYMRIDPPNLGTHRISPKFFRGHSRKSLLSGRLLLLVLGYEPDGSKTLYQCPLIFETRHKAFAEYLGSVSKKHPNDKGLQLPRGKFFDKFR